MAQSHSKCLTFRGSELKDFMYMNESEMKNAYVTIELEEDVTPEVDYRYTDLEYLSQLDDRRLKEIVKTAKLLHLLTDLLS